MSAPNAPNAPKVPKVPKVPNTIRALNPQRKRRHKPAAVREPAPGNPLNAYLAAWLEWGAVKGNSEQTLRNRRGHLLRFIVWCDERAIVAPTQITRALIERYQRHLWQYRKRDGAPLSVRAQLLLLNDLAGWFGWLVRQRHVLYNPASDLELPRKPLALPKTILTVSQVEGILNQAEPSTALGVRARAILEVLYSSGVRRMELINLKVYDIDTVRGTLMVRVGKGGKDRFIPIGARACAWVDKYLAEVRPQLLTDPSEQHLFLDDFGRPMPTHFAGDLVRRHLEAAGITTPGSCHIFRHACATHMLEGGADIRYIQAMLGHASLETTQIYTRVSMVKLKEIHSATHPARLQRLKGVVDKADPQDDAQDAAAALLDALAGEEDGDEGGDA